MKVPDFIEVYENAVPHQLCDDIIEAFETQEVMKPQQGIYQKMGESEQGTLYRNDASLQLDALDSGMSSAVYTNLNEVLASYFEKYSQLREMSIRSVGVKIQKTEQGGGYHQFHCEKDGFEVTSRVLVWTVYLNDVDEGGETELLLQQRRIKPKKGTIVIFPAGFTHTHRGNPPISGVKYIATGWYNLF